MAVQEWLPDWRDPQQYPDLDKHPLTSIAWEFLRRNPEYQEDYARLWGSLSESDRRAKIEEILPQLRGETDEDYRQRWEDSSETAGRFYSEVHPLGWLKKKWGIYDDVPLWSLRDSLDPAKSRSQITTDLANEGNCSKESPDLSFELDYSPAISPGSLHYIRWNERCIVQTMLMGGGNLESLVEAAEKEIDNNECVTKCSIEIDLLLPINVQLDRLKEVLKAKQKHIKEIGFEPKTPRPAQKLPTYLRVLDAKLTGALDGDIATVIYPHRSNDHGSNYHASDLVRKDFKKALSYRDQRYRELPLLQKWAKQRY